MGAALARARDPLDLHTAERMLQHVDAHDRDTWVQVGKALAAEFGDGAAELFRSWSARAENFSERGCRDTWRSCVRKPGGYSAGTLVALALRGGFTFERRTLDDADRARLELLRAQARARRDALERQRELDALSAQARARLQWRAAARDGVSLYAERKGIRTPEAVRYGADGALLIPMVRLDLPQPDALRGLQAIYPDGAKRFSKGMDKAGSCCRLGLVDVAGPLLLCEGWATGMSLRMGLALLGRALPVFVCFDAGNLLEVSRLLGELHPGNAQVLCADDDWQTRDKAGRPLNPGRVAAAQARDDLQAAGGRALCAHPVWRGVRQPGWTDFNDLHTSQGLEAVATQVALALEVLDHLGARRRG